MADPRTHLFANNAHCLLGEDLGAAETSLQLESGKGALFPDPGDGEIFIFTIEDLVQGVREVCYCSKRSGDVLTIERGKEGTSARDWIRSNTVIVQQRITAGTLEYLAESGSGGSGNARLDTAQEWIANQWVSPVTVAVVDNAVTIDCEESNTFIIDLYADVTTLTLSNPRPGMHIMLVFVQDATGGHTVTWPADFHTADLDIGDLPGEISLVSAQYINETIGWLATIKFGFLGFVE